MAYTRDGIMAQIYVAFGQGTGAVRVSQEVCAALRERYYPFISDQLIASWEKEAVQVLERIRALGRLLALEAGMAGKTSIPGAAFRDAAITVENQSGTPFCPPH